MKGVRHTLQIAAASGITAVAWSFKSYGARNIVTTVSSTPPALPIRRRMPPPRGSLNYGTGSVSARSSRLPNHRASSISLSTANAYASSLRTRGGGSDQGDAGVNGERAVGTELAETDPEVWEIIEAERRRQVGASTGWIWPERLAA